jgi:serine/threonine protein kinase
MFPFAWRRRSRPQVYEAEMQVPGGKWVAVALKEMHADLGDEGAPEDVIHKEMINEIFNLVVAFHGDPLRSRRALAAAAGGAGASAAGGAGVTSASVELGDASRAGSLASNANLVGFRGILFDPAVPIQWAPGSDRHSDGRPRAPVLMGLALIMEYVHGVDLATLLHVEKWSKQWAEAAAPLAAKLRLLADVANGLEALHLCDTPVAHLDIKPANVLVTWDGAEGAARDRVHWPTVRAQITDYGLATPLTSTAGSSRVRGNLAGTMPFWSPEAVDFDAAAAGLADAEGRRVRRVLCRRDVWAWGCVAAEALTAGSATPWQHLKPGRPISSADIGLLVRALSSAGFPLMTSVIHGTRTTPQVIDAVPAAVREVIEWAWQRDPAARVDAGQIEARLRDVLGASVPEVVPALGAKPTPRSVRDPPAAGEGGGESKG